MAQSWLKKAINPAHKGKLHKALGVPLGEKIPADKLAKAKAAGGRLGKMATLAETMKGFHH